MAEAATFLTEEEQDRLLSVPNENYPTGLRNKAIIQLILTTGVKSNELVNLKWSGYSNRIRVAADNRIKDRLTVQLDRRTKDLLDRWKKRQKAELEGREIDRDPEYMFTTLTGKKLSNSYLRQMLYRLSTRAELANEVNPTILRNTFAVEYYRKTKDIKEVQDKLGLKDISMVSKYVEAARKSGKLKADKKTGRNKVNLVASMAGIFPVNKED